MQVYKVIKPSQQIGNFEIMSINSCTCCYCQTAHNASVFANGKQLVPILAKSMCVYVGNKKNPRAGLSDQGSRNLWDLLISCNEIRFFESDGFRFSATRH